MPTSRSISRCSRYITLFPILFCASFAHAAPPAADADGFVPLFNGKDLSGWVPVNVASGVAAPLEDTFTVKDGLIVCTGVPTGVMRSEKMYENFIAELEWRHLKPGGNSGFFLFADAITSKGVPFARGLEVQILDGVTPADRRYTTQGDLFPIHGATARPDHPGKFGMRSYPIEDRTKASPEWNHYRVESIDGTVTLSINGKVVNSIKEVSPRRGYLCLESEGGLIHFRNLRIKELPPNKDLDPKHVAIADQGFKSIYTGLDLSGWKPADDAARPAWSAVDWTLHFDPDKLPKDAAKPVDATLWTATRHATFAMILDIKSETRVDLLLPGAAGPIAIPDADPAAAGKARKGWRRIQIVRSASEILITGDDIQPSKHPARAIDPANPADPATGPIGLRPAGAADFANLYIGPATDR